MKKKYIPFAIILIVLAIGSVYLVQNVYKTDNNAQIAKQTENINGEIENNDSDNSKIKDDEQIDSNEIEDNKQVDESDTNEQKEATLIYFSTAT